VLDAWSRGESREAAILHAQARGFVEADPTQDLSGRDSADKLALLIEASFSEWIRPEHICTQGIDAISDNPIGYKVIARARRSRSPEHGSPHITVSVSPERPPPGSFLGEAYGPENRLEIELDSGEIIRLRAQGAGRWPTSVSVLGDLHEIARLVEQTREVSVSQPITSHG
jgi:homoserine dehydrogenase